MNWLETQIKAIDESGYEICSVELLKASLQYAYQQGQEDGYQEGYGDGFQSIERELCD